MVARLRSRTGHHKGKMQLDIQLRKCNLVPEAPATDGRCWVTGWQTQNSGPSGGTRGACLGKRVPAATTWLQMEAWPLRKVLTSSSEDLGSRETGRVQRSLGDNAGFQEQNQEARGNCSWP